LAFYTKDDIPDQEDGKKYYSFIIQEATKLFNRKLIKEVIRNTFSGLFVDEYQDCSLEQHQLILVLSSFFPTRILGDYLQGIFGFNSESLVDLKSPEHMGYFWANQYILETPWRWIIGGNETLGQDLKIIRSLLENNSPIDLNGFSSLEVNISNDIYEKNDCNKVFKILNEEESLLILTPESSHINPRVSFIQRFNNLCFLMESIDEKDFYTLSKKFDGMDRGNVFSVIREVSLKLFNKTAIDNWFNVSGVKNKRGEGDKLLLEPIRIKIECLKQEISYSVASELLRDIKNLPDVKCYRKELFASLCRVLEEAESDAISAHEAMLNKRNMIRRVGRKVYGRCIGTTLLTKGLEFDTVLVINAHNFNCPKNLYVALTRASRRLIIFSKSKDLNSYLSKDK
jgi:DNA helicase-2/ATP-dependent DNA helicase PcrA